MSPCYTGRMDMFSSIILGIVQGVTEFLPVSSTGHLVLMHSFLGAEDGSSLAFDAVLHFATACAVIIYFFGDIRRLVQAMLRKLGRLPVHEKDWDMVQALVIGTIPAVILGLLLESYMETIFRNPVLVAGVLIAGSFFFMYAEYVYESDPRAGSITPKKGLQIGLFQTLALLPGMSRSGSTLAGGMILGLTRSEAARFSFLLAIPVIVGGGAKKFFELMASDVPVAWITVGAGAVTAFIVGLLSIHFMITFVRRYSLWPFIWYRIALAAFVLLVAFLG